MPADRPEPRVSPLDPPYSAEVEAELTRWMPPGGDVEPLALFRTMAVNALLTEAMRPLGAHLLSRRARIDKLAREVVIARICARNGCEYEWGVHVVAFAGAAGLTEKQVAATAADRPDLNLFEPREQALLRLCDELCDTSKVSDDTWSALVGHFDDEQCLTLLVLAGWYHVISFVANGTNVPREDWAARFPASA